MTATTSTNNLSYLSSEDSTSQIGAFLKEHGEVEMILPAVIGVFIATRFKLRGANALIVNLLVASIARQIFIHLKQEKQDAVSENNNSSSNKVGIGASEVNFQDYAIAHAVPGRVRLRMPQLAINADFARRLEQALNADEYVKSVRINRAATSVTINYDNQGLSDWELGMRLMDIVNKLS